MNNSEFYTPQENWPQPADDPATLLPAEPPEAAPKKQKKKRLRKKMSESLSGMTAAALAVVMLTTAVFDDKGGFGGGLDVSPGGGGVEICPVCYDPYCDYFVDGYPGLRISGAHIDSGDGLYQPYDLYHMNGMTDYYTNYLHATFGLFTEDGQRLVFHLNQDLYRNHWSGMDNKWRDINEDPLWSNTGTTGKAGQMIVIRDPKSDEYLGFVMAYLVYDPNGAPGFDADAPWKKYPELLGNKTVPEFRTIPVAGVPNAEIQIYTDLGSDYADAVMQYCSVDVAPYTTVQKIGKTMKLTESEDIRRDYRDMQVSGAISHMGQEEDRRVFEAEFSFASYSYVVGTQNVGGGRVMFLPGVNGEDWNVILRRAADLNQKAKETGHPVCFPLLQLTDVTISGITYDIWMAYQKETDEKSGETWYRPQYVFVPRQEKTVAFTYDIDRLSEEDLTALLRDPAEFFTPQNMSFIWIMEQVSLR